LSFQVVKIDTSRSARLRHNRTDLVRQVCQTPIMLLTLI